MEIIFSTSAAFFLGGILAFVFGTVVGSFLNVVVLRHNTGVTLQGRSECFSCKQQLAWIDLVPVFSFMFLKGRCRSCNSLLSLQYPLVELVTGSLFVALFAVSSSLLTFFVLAGVCSLYVVIGVYDVRHSIVPNKFAYAAALISFLLLFFDSTLSHITLPTLLDFLAGPLVAAPLFLLWLFSRGRWMGLGDAKLMLSIGWLLGIPGGMFALLVAFWIGALFGLAFLAFYSKRVQTWVTRAGKTKLFLYRKSPTIKSEIPFAPFLLLGFFVAFFCNLTIFDILLWSF